MSNTHASVTIDTPVILAIDEDKDAWLEIEEELRRRGFDFHIATHPQEGFQKLDILAVDLVLLDESVPGVDYLDIIREIETKYALPLFVLSRRKDPSDKVTSLELGAEDFIYICKPFDINELSARIKSQLKLVAAIKANATLQVDGRALQFEDWILDLDRHELRHVNDGPVDLTAGELGILKALTLSAGRVLTREQLFNQTRGHDGNSFDRSVDVQISRIRQKLNHDIIRTVRGVGYMLDSDPERLE